jgi:hypothetical protein
MRVDRLPECELWSVQREPLGLGLPLFWISSPGRGDLPFGSIQIHILPDIVSFDTPKKAVSFVNNHYIKAGDVNLKIL